MLVFQGSTWEPVCSPLSLESQLIKPGAPPTERPDRPNANGHEFFLSFVLSLFFSIVYLGMALEIRSADIKESI